MPNWVRNIIKTNEETINKIKEKFFENDVLSFNKIIPMPESLRLESGSQTRDAIFYSYIKKGEEEQKNIKKILENNYDGLDEKYTKMISDISEKRQKYIEEFAKKYEPSEQEKRLGITTFEELGDAYINNIKEYGSCDWYDWCIDNWGTKWDIDFCSHDDNSIVFDTAWSTPSKIIIALSATFPNDDFEVTFADEDYCGGNNGIYYLRGGIVTDYELDKGEEFAANVWGDELDYSDESLDIVDDMFD